MRPLERSALRHRLSFYREQRLADGRGGFTTTWPRIFTAMAEALGLDGRESVMERVFEGVSVYRFRIRWRSGLKPRQADQIVFDGETLNIKSATDPDGRREQIVIVAETASAQALN